ncbi:hypothetical protein [Streptomyces qinzhouensis]|uniref:Uncharacterized protein n=1 Tax=Streptomyces qinzhouensis TaxID=2599401 RepID=A0A5B8IG80_9ACTN|nr:hypothetical protein [Streptomyces qinzhouensis]QDY76259.1 hypothetical protein FQU76_06630 [Streptomyces qinzhouensis]
MMVRRLLAGVGAGAVVAFGAMAVPAQAAQAKGAQVTQVAPAAVPDVGILSCPSGAPAAAPGFRCLSSYLTNADCIRGVARNIEVTPATEGYCTYYNGRYWGFVNH